MSWAPKVVTELECGQQCAIMMNYSSSGMPFGILNLICNSKTLLVVAFSQLLMMMMISIGKLWIFSSRQNQVEIARLFKEKLFALARVYFFGMFSTLSRRYHLIIIIDSSLILSLIIICFCVSPFTICDSFDVALFVAVSQTVYETLLPSFHIFSALTLHP